MISKINTLNSSFNETYTYDDLNQLANMTRGGTAYQSWNLDALGNMQSVTTNGLNWQYGFQGGRYDASTGLYDFRNRLYSPTMMRWMSNDPLGYVDGANTYQFVASNPVKETDPSGLLNPGSYAPIVIETIVTQPELWPFVAIGAGLGLACALVPYAPPDVRFQNPGTFDIPYDPDFYRGNPFRPTPAPASPPAPTPKPTPTPKSTPTPKPNPGGSGKQPPNTPPTRTKDGCPDDDEPTKGKLRDRLGKPPSNMKNPQAHHDLPQAPRFQDKWKNAGLDPEDPNNGRWVEGGPEGNHQKWSYDFNKEWDNFFQNNPNANRDQILDQMNNLRNDPRFQ